MDTCPTPSKSIKIYEDLHTHPLIFKDFEIFQVS
jgi:hypothetical protein